MRKKWGEMGRGRRCWYNNATYRFTATATRCVGLYTKVSRESNKITTCSLRLYHPET